MIGPHRLSDFRAWPLLLQNPQPWSPNEDQEFIAENINIHAIARRQLSFFFFPRTLQVIS